MLKEILSNGLMTGPSGEDGREGSTEQAGAPNGNFRENICSEDDFRSRIFGAFVVKFLACLLS